jgi:hypothetical protein
MPKTEITPSVVIYIEGGEIKLVQADVPFNVYLVDYDIVDTANAIELEDPAYPNNPDWVNIDELDAEVDVQAVESIVGLYLENYETVDDDDPVVVRKA